MRFIHIADVHLGMQPDAGFPWSEERGEAIWESFRRIIRLAGREKPDFLLIAGRSVSASAASAGTERG